MAGAALKPVPAIVTVVPIGPDAGENDVITGVANQVKPGREEDPPGFVTITFPVPPLPTIALILVDELTMNDNTFIPPTVTPVVPVKEVPVIFKIVPSVPCIGVNDITVGKEIKPVIVAVPPGVVTVTAPDVPDGTTALIVVGDTTMNEVASIPANFTDVTLIKFVPVIVTVVPAAADAGVNDDMVGVGIKVNPAKESLPVGVSTFT